MTDTTQPQFLDAQSYRRKRLMDAARMLPVLGALAVLFPLPFLFLGDSASRSGLAVALYLFCLWLALIAFALFLARRLGDPGRDE
jgi:hypothetical protein